MLYLFIVIIAFGIVIYVLTYIRSIRKLRREINGLIAKEN